MTTDNSSSVYVQRYEYNTMQSAQPEVGCVSGCLVHGLGSNDHLPGTNSASPHPTMNQAALSLERFSSTMGYDDPPHLATGSGGYLENQSQHQVDGYSTPVITQSIPLPLGPPRFEYYAPSIPEVPIDGPPSHVPLPHNVTGLFRENPGLVHSRMLITEDLKYIAGRYLHNPGSHVSKLRVKRSRSGAEKVLISLDIPIAPGPPPSLPESYAEIPEYLHGDPGPLSHAPLPYYGAGPSQGNPSLVRSGMSGTEDFEDLAGRYLHNPGSHVNKLRMKRSRSGVKVLILLELDVTVTM